MDGVRLRRLSEDISPVSSFESLDDTRLDSSRADCSTLGDVQASSYASRSDWKGNIESFDGVPTFE